MEYELGNICHIEVAAPDMEKTKDFYGEVFGWTFTQLHDHYEFFDAGNMRGGLDADGTPQSDGTVLVLACEDIDEKLSEIEGAGGTTLRERTEIEGGRGFYAYFVDPVGNRMGLWMPAVE